MQEDNWLYFYQQTVEPFWQQHAFEWVYQPEEGFNVHYVLVEHPSKQKLVILSPGRVESFLKYKELIFDFYQQGYSVLSVDHRGQGQSSRELDDNEKGFISNFDRYADDLNAICSETRVFQQYPIVNIVAHSMGSAIALDFLCRYQPDINAAVISAPMLGINAGALNQSMARFVSQFLQWVYSPVSAPKYMFGQTPYQRSEFNNNELTSCKARFNIGQDILSTSDIRLGGVTVNWIYQALSKANWLKKNTDKLPCPTLLLQAELDNIVSNPCQKQWFTQAKANNKTVEMETIKGAKHEILMETDTIRQPVIERIFEFLDQH